MGGPTFGQNLVLLDEGVVLGQIKRINFVGPGVVATRVGFDGVITIGGGGGGSITSIGGGVGITATPTDPIVTAGDLDLDIFTLTTETVLANGDWLPFVDVSVGTNPAAQRKITVADFALGLLPFVIPYLPAGPPGEDGEDGRDGAQGSIGATGATGPQGPTGATGSSGAMGPAGEDGADGADGATGPRGLQGVQGVPGSPGMDGDDGDPGPIGPIGPRGFTGPSGPGSSITFADLNDAIDDAISNAIIGLTGAPDLGPYLYKPGIAGGQYAYGGTKTGDRLDLDSTTATHTEDLTGSAAGSYIVANDTILLRGGALGTLLKWTEDQLDVTPSFMNFAGRITYSTSPGFGIGPIGILFRTHVNMLNPGIFGLNVLPSFINEISWSALGPLTMQAAGNIEGCIRDAPTWRLFAQTGHATGSFLANSKYWGFESAFGLGATLNLATTPPVALAGAGLITAGNHSWKVTNVYNNGIELPSAASAILATAPSQVTVTIAVASDALAGLGVCTARKIYRTVAGNAPPWKLVGTVADNTTTTFLDNLADGGLGADIPATPTNGATLPVRVGWHFSDAILRNTLADGVTASSITDQTAFEVPACIAGSNSNVAYGSAITSALAANRAFADTGGAPTSLVGMLFQSYTPTNETVPTGFGAQWVKRQQFTGTQRLVVQGTARVRGN